MKNTDIAKITGLTEETISRIANDSYKGDSSTINWVKFLLNYKGEYIEILFKNPVFSSLCELVIEKASGKDADKTVKFASICLMRYEELNAEIADADRLTKIDPAHMLKLLGFEPKSISELFLDDEFEKMCMIAIQKCTPAMNKHGYNSQSIRLFASLCYEASHFYRVKMGRVQNKLHGNRHKSRKPKTIETDI